MLMIDSEQSIGQRTAARTSLRFAKMQALGNDFVMVSEDDLNALSRASHFEVSDKFLSNLARKICDRHFSVGADGLIVVRRSKRDDCELAWNYLNSDGSTSVMCGNGLRCLALWAHENGWVDKSEFAVETGVGPVQIKFESARKISSDIAEPIFAAGDIPVDLEAGGLHVYPKHGENENRLEQLIRRKFSIDAKDVTVTCLSMGNPHCVTFVDSIDETVCQRVASKLQSHPFFPEGVNVEFVQIESADRLNIVVWERGCGKTLACASGAAAALVAAVAEGHSNRKAEIVLPGGALEIHWDEKDNHVHISGPASFVFDGTIDIDSVLEGSSD